MVRLERQRVAIVVVAVDAAVGAQRRPTRTAAARRVADHEAQPGAARRVRVGSLWPAVLVTTTSASRRPSRISARAIDKVAALVRRSSSVRCRDRLSSCGSATTPELGAEPFQHRQHEEVRALEPVPREARRGFPEHAGRGRRLGGEGHVAGLAGLLADVGAGPPLEVRHLFGEARARLVAERPASFERRRVERVAGRAELGTVPGWTRAPGGIQSPNA